MNQDRRRQFCFEDGEERGIDRRDRRRRIGLIFRAAGAQKKQRRDEAKETHLASSRNARRSRNSSHVRRFSSLSGMSELDCGLIERILARGMRWTCSRSASVTLSAFWSVMKPVKGVASANSI